MHRLQKRIVILKWVAQGGLDGDKIPQGGHFERQVEEGSGEAVGAGGGELGAGLNQTYYDPTYLITLLSLFACLRKSQASGLLFMAEQGACLK